jgi:hypothetical protein
MALRLASDFSCFAGSMENAAALIDGLRMGGPVTLTAPGNSGGSVCFSVPTRPMSYSNVRIALLLARAQLACEGIARPSPQQLRAALTGSGLNPSPVADGILGRRAAGFGWGRIAHSLGLKLGLIVSGTDGDATCHGTGSRDEPRMVNEHRPTLSLLHEKYGRS